jgi:hypothetical protein
MGQWFAVIYDDAVDLPKFTQRFHDFNSVSLRIQHLKSELPAGYSLSFSGPPSMTAEERVALERFADCRNLGEVMHHMDD